MSDLKELTNEELAVKVQRLAKLKSGYDLHKAAVPTHISEGIKDMLNEVKRRKLISSKYENKPCVIRYKKHIDRVNNIVSYVAEEYDVQEQDMLSRSRTQEYSFPRHVTWYLIKKLCGDLSYPQIARRLKRTDHTTVIYAVKKIQALMDNDIEFEFKINHMIEELRDE